MFTAGLRCIGISCVATHLTIREAILMALVSLMFEDGDAESLVNKMKDLFRNWGDQVASQNGNGLLVSMWYYTHVGYINASFAASMMAFDPARNLRKPSTYDLRGSSRSASPGIRARSPAPSNALKSANIPIIRTQQPSPTESSISTTPKQRATPLGSPQGRNWAEFTTFMRKQRDRGYSEIRVQKAVHFKDLDSPSSESSSPSLPLPVRPNERSRPNSPASRPIPHRRYIDDEDWSQRRRPSLRDNLLDGNDRVPSPSPRKQSLPNLAAASRAAASDSTSRRRGHDVSSPLPFGARGLSVKPPTDQAIQYKDEKRDIIPGDVRERENGEKSRHERRENGKTNGIGHGIQGPLTREKVGRI
jgi:hypothetical protein